MNATHFEMVDLRTEERSEPFQTLDEAKAHAEDYFAGAAHEWVTFDLEHDGAVAALKISDDDAPGVRVAEIVEVTP